MQPLALPHEGPLAIEPSLRGVPRIEEFLRVIVANPDTDEPRLILADWLLDQGLEDRAELIQIQCRLAQLKDAGRDTSVESRTLWDRCRQLIQQNEEWTAGDGLDLCQFHRGLLEMVVIENVIQFLDQVPDLRRQTILQALRVRCAPNQHLDLLGTVSGLDAVYWLNLSGVCCRGRPDVHRLGAVAVARPSTRAGPQLWLHRQRRNPLSCGDLAPFFLAYLAPGGFGSG